MKGTVKWYNSEKGFGFIKGEDDQEHFVHYSKLPQGQSNIREEDNLQVEFDSVKTDRGLQAENVKFVESSQEDSNDEN